MAATEQVCPNCDRVGTMVCHYMATPQTWSCTSCGATLDRLTDGLTANERTALAEADYAVWEAERREMVAKARARSAYREYAVAALARTTAELAHLEAQQMVAFERELFGDETD